MNLALLWVVFSLGCVALQASLAYTSKTLFVSQMKTVGLLPGVPFIGHLGMWLDVFLMTPLLYFMIRINGASWSKAEVVTLMTAGVVASYFMHESYKGAKYPEAHVMNGEITSVGYVHMVYMAVAIGVILLNYFCTEGGAEKFIWISTGLLIVHVIAGTHVPMKLLKFSWFSPGSAFDIPAVATILGSALALVGVSAWVTC